MRPALLTLSTCVVLAIGMTGCGSSSDTEKNARLEKEVVSLRTQVVAAETKVDDLHANNAKLVRFFESFNKFGDDFAKAESACVSGDVGIDAYGDDGVCGRLEKADRRLRSAAKKLGTPDLPTE